MSTLISIYKDHAGERIKSAYFPGVSGTYSPRTAKIL